MTGSRCVADCGVRFLGSPFPGTDAHLLSPQVIAATNRIDTLDPALLRSGRLDRKIEFPLPNEDARAKIMEIHSRKMRVSKKVNFDELARSTDEFNGAQLKVRLTCRSRLSTMRPAADEGFRIIEGGLCRGGYDCAAGRLHRDQPRALPVRYSVRGHAPLATSWSC